MQIDLTCEQKAALEKQHKTERDKRIADRIKAVLLVSSRIVMVLLIGYTFV